MAKIDYTKIEQQIQKIQQAMQKKQLEEGKPIISARAQEYYGVNKEPRPIPEEAIEKLLNEEKDTSENTEMLTRIESASDMPEIAPPSDKNETESISKTPTNDTLYQYPKSQRSSAPRPELDINLNLTSEKVSDKISPLYVLRQHIFWMKRQHIDKRYELIGSSRDEVFGLRKKERLQEADLIRVQELIKKAVHVRAVWEKKKLGAASIDELIEIQKKRAKNKRFNVRDKWIPL